MKTLNETKNKNFKLLCDCIGNQCLKIKKDDEWQKVNFNLSPDDSIKIYSSGALLISKIDHNIHIMFVKNNGEILLEAEEFDLNDIGATINDINVTVYSSGVLQDIYFNDGSHQFYYHTYLGSYFHERDYSKLVAKVNNYEQAIKDEHIYNTSFEEECSNGNYGKFLLDCLHDENNL